MSKYILIGLKKTCLGVLDRGERDKANETGLKEEGVIEMSNYSASITRCSLSSLKYSPNQADAKIKKDKTSPPTILATCGKLPSVKLLLCTSSKPDAVNNGNMYCIPTKNTPIIIARGYVVFGFLTSDANVET